MRGVARRRVRGQRSDGARALDGYLLECGVSVPAFCESFGLDRIAVQRAMSGDAKRVSLDLAFAIQSATGGAVPAESWRAVTVRPDPVSGDQMPASGPALPSDDELDATA